MEKVHGRIIEYLIRGRTIAAAVRFPFAICLASKNRFNVGDGTSANDLRDLAAVFVVVTAANTFVVVDSTFAFRRVGDNRKVRNTGVALKLAEALCHVSIVGVSFLKLGYFSIGVGACAEGVRGGGIRSFVQFIFDYVFSSISTATEFGFSYIDVNGGVVEDSLAKDVATGDGRDTFPERCHTAAGATFMVDGAGCRYGHCHNLDVACAGVAVVHAEALSQVLLVGARAVVATTECEFLIDSVSSAVSVSAAAKCGFDVLKVKRWAVESVGK